MKLKLCNIIITNLLYCYIYVYSLWSLYIFFYYLIILSFGYYVHSLRLYGVAVLLVSNSCFLGKGVVVASYLRSAMPPRLLIFYQI